MKAIEYVMNGEIPSEEALNDREFNMDYNVYLVLKSYYKAGII